MQQTMGKGLLHAHSSWGAPSLGHVSCLAKSLASTWQGRIIGFTHPTPYCVQLMDCPQLRSTALDTRNDTKNSHQHWPLRKEHESQ